MKKGDFKTLSQAQKYYQGRFRGGLEIVDRDEMKILNNWLASIPMNDRKVLDLGTGVGRVINSLLKYRLKKVYALDVSEAMLKFLRKIYYKETRRGVVELINSPSDKIPLSANYLDLVTAFHLFKHLPDIKPTIEQVNKVLRPGGYFIFDILNLNSLIKFGLGDCYGLTSTQIGNILDYHGFTIKDMVFLHPLGETVYLSFGKAMSIVPKTLETIISRLSLKAGTKIFILAQKNE